METNEHILKLTGKANLPQELNLGHSYRVLLDGEVVSITDSNNQDGTKNKVYKFEPIIATITKENGETIKTKDTRSKSTQLRKVIYAIWMNNNSPMDAEDFYEKTMNQIIINAESFIPKL